MMDDTNSLLSYNGSRQIDIKLTVPGCSTDSVVTENHKKAGFKK